MTETDTAPGRTVSRRWAMGGALVGAAVTGSGSTLMHLAGSSPATTGLYRSLLALPALVAMAVMEAKRHPSARVARWPAALAGAFLAGDVLMWQRSILTLGAGLSTVVQNTQVVWVALAGWLLFRERVPGRVVLLLPVLVLGVACIALGGQGGSGSDPGSGTVLAVASAVSYAAFIVLLRGRLSRPGVRSRSLLLITVSCALVSAVVGVVLGGLRWLPGWEAIGWLAVLAVTSQVLGWTVLMAAISRIGALRGSIVLLLQPVSALLWAALVLGERPGGWQIVGLSVVLAVVAAMSVPSRPAPGSRPCPGASSRTNVNAGLAGGETASLYAAATLADHAECEGPARGGRSQRTGTGGMRFLQVHELREHHPAGEQRIGGDVGPLE